MARRKEKIKPAVEADDTKPVIPAVDTNSREYKDKAARHAQAVAELKGYGVTPKPFEARNVKTGGLYRTAYRTAEGQLGGARAKALRVSQREQLRAQNQELKTLDLQGKRRRRGRGSLLSYVSSQKNTLGPSGSLQ